KGRCYSAAGSSAARAKRRSPAGMTNKDGRAPLLEEIGVAPELPRAAGTPPVDGERVARARDWLAAGRRDADFEPGARKRKVSTNFDLAHVCPDFGAQLLDVADEALDEGFAAEGFGGASPGGDEVADLLGVGLCGYGGGAGCGWVGAGGAHECASFSRALRTMSLVR